MTPKHFVHLAKLEHDRQLEWSFTVPPTTAVAAKIAELKLDPERLQLLREAVRLLLTDVFYTWLLSLDGSGGLGPEQHSYTLIDDDGDNLTESSLIEAYAWEEFHGNPAGQR